MCQIRREHDATEGIGGKNLHHTAEYGESRPGPVPDRQVFDVVTDDATVYRFARASPSGPWSFEPGQHTTDPRAGKHGKLPGVVEAILDAEFTDEDGRPDPGWHY